MCVIWLCNIYTSLLVYLFPRNSSTVTLPYLVWTGNLVSSLYGLYILVTSGRVAPPSLSTTHYFWKCSMCVLWLYNAAFESVGIASQNETHFFALAMQFSKCIFGTVVFCYSLHLTSCKCVYLWFVYSRKMCSTIAENSYTNLVNCYKKQWCVAFFVTPPPKKNRALNWMLVRCIILKKFMKVMLLIIHIKLQIGRKIITTMQQGSDYIAHIHIALCTNCIHTTVQIECQIRVCVL